MLDAFLEVASGQIKEAEAFDALVEDFQNLPDEELYAIAQGTSKLAYHDHDGDWLEKFEGTEFYDDALALEEECLNVDIAQKQQQLEEDARREEERANKPESTDFYRQKDAISLKKRILDLNLNKSKLPAGGGVPAEAAEEEGLPEAMEPSDGAGEPGPFEDLKEAFAKEAAQSKEASSFISPEVIENMRKQALSPGQRAALGLGAAAAGLGAVGGYNRGEPHGQGMKGAGLGALGTVSGGVVGGAVGQGVLHSPRMGAALGAAQGYNHAVSGFDEKDKNKKKQEKKESKEAEAKTAMGAALLAGIKGLGSGAKALGKAGVAGAKGGGAKGALQSVGGLGKKQVGQAAQWAGKNRGAAATMAGGALGTAALGGAALSS